MSSSSVRTRPSTILPLLLAAVIAAITAIAVQTGAAAGPRSATAADWRL